MASHIYQTTHLEALFYFTFVTGRFSVFLGVLFVKRYNFCNALKPGTKFFGKLEWELWICPIKSTFFFGWHLFYCCGFTVIVAFLCVLFLLRILLLIILSLWGFTDFLRKNLNGYVCKANKHQSCSLRTADVSPRSWPLRDASRGGKRNVLQRRWARRNVCRSQAISYATSKRSFIEK